LNGPGCDNEDSFCDSTTGTCQPALKVGAACKFTGTFGPGGSGGCVGYAACRNGICVELPGIGEPCGVADGGEPRNGCRHGTCANGTCEPPAPFACTVETALRSDAGAPD
jgi:hypothetical protein